MIKLTQEEKELIQGMMSSDEWKVIEKLCDMAVEEQQVEVLTTSINDGSREIVIRKARLEGAIKVGRFFNTIKGKLKKEGLDG